MLRATFATNAYNKGIDIGIIAEILGHANLESVKEYIKISTAKVRQTISQIGFLRLVKLKLYVHIILIVLYYIK